MGKKEQDIILDLHELESTAILDFFRIFPDEINDPNFSIDIHGGTSGFYQPIVWQGVSYIPIPIEVSEFESNGDGTLPRPSIKIANVDYIISQWLQIYDGFTNAKVVRKQVFAKYLDDVNFKPEGVNPYVNGANPDMGFEDEVFYINNKKVETKTFVEFELVSPLELENIESPRRIMLAKYCPFAYRGDQCGYTNSTNLYDEKDNQLNSVTVRGEWSSDKVYNEGDVVYLFSKNKLSISPNDELTNANDHLNPEYAKIFFVCKSEGVLNKSPFKRGDLWSRDICSHQLGGCIKRFGNKVRFGGFPATNGFGT